jgi:hypothetical protein
MSWLHDLARYLLRDELDHLTQHIERQRLDNEACARMLGDHQETIMILDQSLLRARSKVGAQHERMTDLAFYCDWLRKRDADKTFLLFLRDYLREPQVNTGGVHPAVRWNITSFLQYKQEQAEDNE